MLYSLENLPEQVTKIEKKLQQIWFCAYEMAIERSADDLLASKVAWDVVKRTVNNPIEFTMYITKANLDKEGKMQFCATASDTNKDTYRERMSVELFQGFVQDFTGQEYISLAHYPRFRNKIGEVGLITSFYVDGTYLKAKGYFHDTELGKTCFDAIRKDKTDDVPVDERIRVSIAFFDRKHLHESSGYVWDYKDGKLCFKCMAGQTTDKVYLAGKAEHLALTRKPANKRTDIIPQDTDTNDD